MTNSADQEYSAVAGDARWQAIGKVGPRCLGQARWLALNIVQWPARIANSYVTGSTWPERTWMAWQPAADAIVTRSFDRALSLRLDLRTLELCFLEQGRRVPHAFDPDRLATGLWRFDD